MHHHEFRAEALREINRLERVPHGAVALAVELRAELVAVGRRARDLRRQRTEIVQRGDLHPARLDTFSGCPPRAAAGCHGRARRSENRGREFPGSSLRHPCGGRNSSRWSSSACAGRRTVIGTLRNSQSGRAESCELRGKALSRSSDGWPPKLSTLQLSTHCRSVRPGDQPQLVLLDQVRMRGNDAHAQRRSCRSRAPGSRRRNGRRRCRASRPA